MCGSVWDDDEDRLGRIHGVSAVGIGGQLMLARLFSIQVAGCNCRKRVVEECIQFLGQQRWAPGPEIRRHEAKFQAFDAQCDRASFD